MFELKIGMITGILAIFFMKFRIIGWECLRKVSKSWLEFIIEGFGLSFDERGFLNF
jgi:hypothetical protein